MSPTQEHYLDDASLTRRQLDEHGLAVCTTSRAATADLSTLIASAMHTNTNDGGGGGNGGGGNGGGGLTASADEWDLANLLRLKELDGKVRPPAHMGAVFPNTTTWAVCPSTTLTGWESPTGSSCIDCPGGRSLCCH